MSEDKITLDNNSEDDAANNLPGKSTEQAGTQPDSEAQDKGNEPVAESTEKELHNIDSSTAREDNSTEEASGTTEEQPSDPEAVKSKKTFHWNTFQIIRILCIIGFVFFSVLFINEVIIQPYRIKKSIEYTRELYHTPTEGPTNTPSPTLPASVTAAPTPSIPATPTPDPNRDEQGRLLQFKDLLAVNDDVKGWLTIPDTNVNYVVVQSDNGDSNYYLDKDLNLDYSKAGTLFIDPHSSIEKDTQNIVIHGHNMVSTVEKMFHYLLKYKKVSYYQEHPVITFDSIYNTGKWKVFAVFITNGSSKKEPLFDYTRSTFSGSSDFLNFIYQIKIRSVLNIDGVDINENDQLLMLSTCSYESDNYRTVIVARKVRDGEDPDVDTDKVTVNETPLYPESYYYRNGGEAPELPATFEDALAAGDITWYNKPEGTVGN